MAKDKRATAHVQAADCAGIFRHAQNVREAGRLREARDLFLACARPACGAYQRKCESRASDIEASLSAPAPADDSSGRSDAPVSPAARAASDETSGVAPEGAAAHETTPASVPATAPVGDPPKEEAQHGSTLLPVVLGAAGLGALGAAALLTYWGKTDNDLLARCAPYCSPASVDHIRQLYIASDIAIGTGVAAIGIAAVLFVTSHRHGDQGEAAPKTPPRQACGFDVVPTPSGAFASVSGAF
jgi:hypothetical protein